MKKYLVIAYITYLNTLSSEAFADPIHIKLAVIENLKFEKLSTDKYANDYMDGLQTAIDTSKDSGIDIELKTFFYDKDPLAILKKIPDVKAWGPDFIIGPRSSSLFLLLADQFNDILVVSPFATANDVAKMPDNFYSMTLTNDHFTQAVVNIVRDRFPKSAVSPIGEVDCKNCMDFISAFITVAKEQRIAVRETTTFLNKNAETIPPAELLTKYQESDVILLPNTSYTSGTLAGRISDHLKDNNITFIGGDGWGDWTTSYVGKVKSKYSYRAFRATPWSLDSSEPRVMQFHKDFKKFRSIPATGAASLMSYSTLMAIVMPFLANKKLTTALTKREQILNAFKLEQKRLTNYGRPTKYAVYKVTQAGETFDGEVSALGEVK